MNNIDQLVGTRAQVYHGKAYKTSYGKTKDQGGSALTKSDLKKNPKTGRIVSKEKSKLAKKEKRLKNAGYVTKKGKFGSEYNSKLDTRN